MSADQGEGGWKRGGMVMKGDLPAAIRGGGENDPVGSVSGRWMPAKGSLNVSQISPVRSGVETKYVRIPGALSHCQRQQANEACLGHGWDTAGMTRSKRGQGER